MGELVLGLGFFVCSFMAHAQAPEGAIVAKNYGGVYQDSVKAWSDPNAWEGGVVPGSGDVVYILNSVIVMDTDVEVAAVIIEPYGYLYLYDVNDEAILKTDGSTQYSGTGNGHGLCEVDAQRGLDVHDVGHWHEPIQAGHVFTVEPGIYIREENLGIRLENDILITEDGYVDLMGHIPLEADEIEAMMAG